MTQRPDSSLRWRIIDWLWLKRLDFDYWRETRRRRAALRRWRVEEWRRFK